MGVLLAVLAARGPVAIAADDTDEAPPLHALEKATDEQRAVYEKVRQRALRLGAEQVTSLADKPGFGLDVGTQIAPMLETLLWCYRYSGDTAFLERFEVLMTALEKSLVEDPDGHLGWYSAAGRRRFGEPWPPSWPDASLLTAWQKAEARVVAVCCDFEMTVRAEPEALKVRFLVPAKRWTELAEERLIGKWEKPCYIELSHDRAVYTWPTQAFKRGSAAWEPYPHLPAEGQAMTLPHTALSEVIREYLKLWQLRGNDDYRTRAAKLLRWQKSCLRFPEAPRQRDRRGRPRGQRKVIRETYWWNTWDPAGAWDFRPEGGLAFGMYVGVEPLDYARDVAAFVEAYHSGVVISRDDINLLVATQTKKMLQGDPTSPSWRDVLGQKRGMLWPHLAEFDETLRTALWATLDPSSFEFGSPVRWLQESTRWAPGARPRNLNGARVISWNRTFEDFRDEMQELIDEHPPPLPTPRRR